MSSGERWFWQEIDAGVTAVSGDFAKEFKNEPVKAPGIFAADRIPPEASLLVREAIQNSWDAARERGGGGSSARELRSAIPVPPA